MAGQMRKEDIGTVIRVLVKEDGVPFDLSSALTLTLKLGKPDGTIATRTMAFQTSGVDGVLVYTTVLADLDQAGPWTGQVYLELPVGKWHTDQFNFVVGDNLGV